jgi:hypothetical protein
MGFAWITDDRGFKAGMSDSVLPATSPRDQQTSGTQPREIGPARRQPGRRARRVTLAERVARLFMRQG